MNRIKIHSENDESLIYIPDFFTKSYLEELASELNWKQNQIFLFGKWHNEPRLTAWYGNPYSYSNIHWPAQQIPPILFELMKTIELEIQFKFNSVLANWYRSGNDSMGWHSDNEPEMDTRCIASVTFGQKRKIAFRSKNDERKIALELHDRSLLLMYNFQKNWQHAIPKSSKPMKDRINLTFRNII